MKNGVAAAGIAAIAALNRLREHLPWAFAEDGGLKVEEVAAAFHGMDVASNERGSRYRFDWAGSQDAFNALQAPVASTLAPCRDLSREFDQTANLFIVGDNLEALKILRDAYRGRVKMIYIDPPYNTGSDFIYKDDYRDPLAQYLRETGQADKAGVTRAAARDEERKVNGRKHSRWMSMMLPRLFIAKELLRKDGVMFVSIDDNELNHLRMLMNLVFGEDRVDAFVWRKTGDDRYGKMRNVSTFRKDHEYILAGFKAECILNKLIDFPDFRNEYSNRDNDPRGPWESGSISRTEAASDRLHENYYSVTSPTGAVCNRQFDFSEDCFRQKEGDNRIVWPKNGQGVPREKIFINEKRVSTPTSLLLNRGSTYSGTQELKGMFAETDIDAEKIRPKPSRLINMLAQLATESDSVVMDFFAGSSTTAYAVMQLNAEDGGARQCISVQLPELIPEKSVARKAGYSTVADISLERLRRAGDKIRETMGDAKIDTGFRVFEMTESAFRSWRGTDEPTIESWQKEEKLALNEPVKDVPDEALIFELMLEEGYPLTSEIKHLEVGRNRVWKISHPELADAGKVLHVCLDEALESDIHLQLGLLSRSRLIVRDKSLTDSLAVDLSTQCWLRAI